MSEPTHEEKMKVFEAALRAAHPANNRPVPEVSQLAQANADSILAGDLDLDEYLEGRVSEDTAETIKLIVRALSGG